MMKFYKDVFGWDVQDIGSADMGQYVLATTTPSTEKGPTKPGAINGGFFPKSKDSAQHPSVVIQVDDIKKHMDMIKKAGGKVLGEPVEIPGMAWYVSFIDSEGNRTSLWQTLH